jgi:hypothetical protein
MDGKWKSGICVVFVVAAILVAFTATPVAAAVTVDGAISPANEWDNPLIEVVDTVDAPGTAPPGYNISQVKVTIEGNTLYCLYIVFGVAGDADGNGDPDTGTGDYPGIGGGTATFGYEQFRLAIDGDNDGTDDYWLRYTWDQTFLTLPGDSNAIVGAVTNGAFGSTYVEMSLADASDYINQNDFCVHAKADTDYTGAEDYADKVCYTREYEPKFNFNFTGIGCYEVEFKGEWAVVDGVDNFNTDGLTIANHTWDYGDGAIEGPISGPPGTVTHTYETCGTKTVKLSGYDSHGNYAETVKDIYVDCGPTAIASANPNCIPGDGSYAVTFDGSKSHADLNNKIYPQSIVFWGWEFSDGSILTGSVVTKVIDEPITAHLTVVDSLGCVDTAVVKVGPCSEVPLVTPLGLIALIGALGAVLLVGIRRRVH